MESASWDFGRIGMRGLGSPLLAWTEDGRASVGLGSARKDSSAIAIGEERRGGVCGLVLDIGGEVAVRCIHSMHSLCLCVRGKAQSWKQHALRPP